MEGKVFYIGTILMMVIFLSIIYLYTGSFRNDEIQTSENQSITIPLKIHRINENSETYTTQRNEDNIRTLIRRANSIWSQAGIALEIRNIVSTTVNTEDITLLLSNRNPGYLRTVSNFDSETINVFLGSALGGVNGIAFSSENSIMVADITTVNDFRTTAHEIGHILGLIHAPPTNRLMARGRNGELLTEEEIRTARVNAVRMFG